MQSNAHSAAATALMLALALTLAACGTSPAEYREAAAKAHAREDFITARAQALAGLKDEPADPAMLDVLVRAQLRMGDAIGARQSIERLRRAGGKAALLARYSAEAELLEGKPEKAVALVTRDLSGEAWRLRAAARRQGGDMAGAAAAFESGLKAGADRRLIAQYAAFTLETGNLRRTRQLLSMLNRQAPGSYDALMLAGALEATLAHPKTALKYYRQAAERYPHRAEPLVGEAEALSALDRPREGMLVLTRASEIDPESQGVRAIRLQLLSQLGDWNGVRGMLQREAANLDPRSSDGMTYGEALLRLGHPEQARVMFQRTVLLDPGNRYARMMLGEAQLASGDAATAFETLEPLTRGLLVLPRELALAAKAADAAGYSETFEMTARLKSAPYKEQVRLANRATDDVLRQDWPGALVEWEALLRHGEDAEVLRRAAFAAEKSGKTELAASYVARADRVLRAAQDQ